MNKDLIKQIQEAPNCPGVYQFFDANNKALYVGKAKDLKKRLTSYTKEENLITRIKKMTSLAFKLEIIQTLSESEALLLECNLIKKLMPRYNILLRDGKTFPYIEVTRVEQHLTKGFSLQNANKAQVSTKVIKEEQNSAWENAKYFAKILKFRGKKDKKNHYFGPFASGYDVEKTIDVLKKSFLLRSCGDSDFNNRKKPCLEYQIKRCSAPCVGFISPNDYQNLVNQAIDFLNGKNSQIQEVLSQKMNELSADFEYEKAAAIRDRIKAISSIQNKQNINILELKNSDIIVLSRKANLAVIYISFYRSGYNYGSKPYFINISEDDESSEIIANFISQFYVNELPANNIILDNEIENKEILEEFLTSQIQNKVNISIPQKGYKYNLIKDQQKLANKELQQKINQNMSNKARLVEVKNIFNLDKIPQRIEVYDNSHISGKYMVGAMICAGQEGFIKNAYRKFNIDPNDLDNKDDTAMMKHVLTRRLKRLNDKENVKPDLIIIDGGKGQLSAVKEVFDNLKITNLNLVCISKGKKRNAGEEYFHQINKENFTLKKDDPVMYYLQNLRDEAHRFAITTHRSKRAKSITKSGLDIVDDIGASRKKLLLNHFGGVEAIKNASIEDLTRVKGIGKELAKKIKNSISS